MPPIARRDVLKAAGFLMATALPGATQLPAGAEWIRTCRGLICEAYNPPFYPSFDFQPRKAGLKTIAYVPLNHPFMDAMSNDPRYPGWRGFAFRGGAR